MDVRGEGGMRVVMVLSAFLQSFMIYAVFCTCEAVQ